MNIIILYKNKKNSFYNKRASIATILLALESILFDESLFSIKYSTIA